MSDRSGLFTGSFDPITIGHVQLIERASRLFDRVYVGIFIIRKKVGLFYWAARAHGRRGLGSFGKCWNCDVDSRVGVTVARNLGVITLIRGLRNAQDLVYEANMDYFNHQLAPELETVYLYAQPPYQAISSTRIRELLAFSAGYLTLCTKECNGGNQRWHKRINQACLQKKKKRTIERIPMADCRRSFLALLLATFVIRLPYYIEMPGTAEDIRSVMTVDGKMDTKPGSYDFVTVAVKEATRLIWSMLGRPLYRYLLCQGYDRW